LRAATLVWPPLTNAAQGDRSTVTDIQRNKQTVAEFYEIAFNAKQPERAATGCRPVGERAHKASTSRKAC
jgi:hypothetical protein